MGRLLSPNETKFWLMDYSAPMNSVVVLGSPRKLHVGQLRDDGAFALPSITLDANSRPRWTDPLGQGVVSEVLAEDEFTWLRIAEQLTDVRVGTEGHPPWHAVVIQHEQASTLVFAVHHALTDYRAALWVAHCFLQGVAPGPLTPAFEELLQPSAFGHPDAEELIRQWWLARAATRWNAIGVPRLAAFLPAPCKSRLSSIRFSAVETAAFQQRCEYEGVTLNGAVAIAMRDTLGMRRVAHSIDLSRFIKPALEDGPGIAISHLFTDIGDGDFWDAAREVRAKLFEQLMAGAAGDELLSLPLALLQSTLDASAAATELTITGGPTLSRRDNAYADYTTQLVVGSPRAGGKVVILSHVEGCLQLISSCPADQPDLPLEQVAECLRRAIA
ncbi:hypothetical protein BH11PSE11_BH11PSE11_34870 [soil metagenome]